MKKLAAVIVETRPLINLAQTIDDHMKMLPPDTDLWLFLGKKNEYLKDLFKDAKIEIVAEPMDLSSYNRLLTSSEFWSMFKDQYERVLIFQSDSMLLSKGIEEFYRWDYIGASWRWNMTYIGNGGLSLRNPQIMYEITQRYPWNTILNEDHWFCMHMYDFKIGNLAPIEEADKFSVEAKYKLGSLGYHAIDKWLTPQQVEKIKTQYQPSYYVNYNDNQFI